MATEEIQEVGWLSDGHFCEAFSHLTARFTLIQAQSRKPEQLFGARKGRTGRRENEQTGESCIIIAAIRPGMKDTSSSHPSIVLVPGLQPF